jgi:hypothetical protein
MAALTALKAQSSTLPIRPKPNKCGRGWGNSPPNDESIGNIKPLFMAHPPGPPSPPPRWVSLWAGLAPGDGQQTPAASGGGAAESRRRVLVVEDVGSGVHESLQREALMRAARRREIDAMVGWRLARWGRSLADLVNTLQELHGTVSVRIRNTQAVSRAPLAFRLMAMIVRCTAGTYPRWR